MGALVLHLIAGVAGYGELPLFASWMYNGVELAAVVVLVARAVLVRQQRLVWSLFAGSVAMTVAGDLTWTALAVDGTLAAGSVADVLYYTSYPLAYAGVVLMLRGRSRRFTPALWLDGLVGALTLASITAALVLTPVLASGGEATDLAINVGYVVADVLLLCFVGLAAGLSSWKPGRAWTLIGVSLTTSAAIDAIYSYQEATGHYAAGSVLSTLWPAGMAALAFAAWQPSRPAGIVGTSLAGSAMPALFAALALTVLGAAHWTTVTDAGVVLALAALVAVAARGALTHRENLRTAATQPARGAHRRADRARQPPRADRSDLDESRSARARRRPASLVLFDLDGFKRYNDTFGHPAGDALLRRLGRALRGAIGAAATAYRLGGDEFCVLAARHRRAPTLRRSSAPRRRAARARRRLRDRRLATASCAPEATPTQPVDALQLADQRMYAAEGRRAAPRPGARRATCCCSVLGEREPDLRDHVDDVAELAVAVARRARPATARTLDEVARAAELHDIGKIAIPDAILDKPGPLDDAEWELHAPAHDHRRAHPARRAGARRRSPRSSAPATSAGTAAATPTASPATTIPLGARIVAVCDAYDAMTSDRTYRRALPHADALAELRRCAGTQFDPAVVDAFARTIDARRATRAADPSVETFV